LRIEIWNLSAKRLSCLGRYIPRVLQLGPRHVSRYHGNNYIYNTHQSDIFRVRSDKYRTGIITIVPVRTASVKIEKYGNFEKER